MSRRRGARLTRTLLVLVMLTAAAAVLARRGSPPTSAASPSAVEAAAAPTDPPSPPKRVPLGRPGVFARPAVAHYLAARPGSVTAAVLDARTGDTFVYRPRGRAITASIVKVDILETLLSEAQDGDRDLTEDERELSRRMIDESDNDAAEDLWEHVGGAPAVARYNARVGLTDTTPNQAGAWGLTTTSALDQARLVQQVCASSEVLSRDSRRYALDLMTHVDPAQGWGVSAGAAPEATVALKNGWLPYDDAWHVNSIGCVRGRGRDYVVAVLVEDESTETSGIDTIEGLSRLLWRQLAPSTSGLHGRRRPRD